MAKVFDRLLFSVVNFADAERDAQILFAVDAIPLPPREGVVRSAVVLGNTVLEFAQRPQERAAVYGLVVRDATAPDAPERISNNRQLALYRCNGSETDALRLHCAGLPGAITAVDHVVLRTADADACIALFRDRLGLRLALDQTVSSWGGRMLFFRAGKFTLEIIDALNGEPEQDFFWGIAYQSEDIEKASAGLRTHGAQVSAVRAGRKPETLVATIKSHSFNVPTLLVQPVPRQ